MLRFIHTADWHLGSPGQHPILADQMLPRLTGLARAEKVDFVLCCGDIFDRPNPDQRIKDRLLAHLTTVPDVQFIFTVGNHDFTSKVRDYHSLITYQLLKSAVKNVHVLESGIHVLDTCNIMVLPENMEMDDRLPMKDQPSVIAWHGTLPGFSVGRSEREEAIAVPVGLLKRYKGQYLALGDIHKHVQITDRCWYSGPPVQKTFSDECGVVVVTINGDKISTKSMDLGLPKKITVPLKFDEGRDSEASVISLVKEEIPEGNILKLQFQLPVKVWASLDKGKIKHSLEKNHALEIRLENDLVDEHRDRAGMKEIAKAKSVFDELETIISVDSYGLDKERLMQTCLKYTKGA